MMFGSQRSVASSLGHVYFSHGERGGGSSPAGASYFNPGGVLDIEAPTVPYRLDLSPEGIECLARQFDRLLSPKNTYLDPAPEFRRAMEPLHQELRSAFAVLQDEGFVVSAIRPIQDQLITIETRFGELCAIASEVDYRRIAGEIIRDAEQLQRLERKLLGDLYSWANLTSREHHGESVDTSFAVSISDADVDDLIAQLSGAGPFIEFEAEASLSPLHLAVRRALCSIVNHRIGNLPILSSELMTYCNPDDWHSRETYAEDRARIPHVIAVRRHFLTYLQLFVEWGPRHADFGAIVEWGQFRTKPLAGR